MDDGGYLAVKYVRYDAGVVGRTLVSMPFPVQRHLLLRELYQPLISSAVGFVLGIPFLLIV